MSRIVSDSKAEIWPEHIGYRFFLSLFMLYMIGACSNQSVDQQGSLDEFTGYLDEQIPDLMKNYGIPGTSVALIRDGESVWSAAYGFADLEPGIAMKVDAVYRAESISKPVTAWGVVALAEKGLVDLDDPVLEYLEGWEFPESEFPADEVTIRRLLSNSAGIPLGSLGEEYAPRSEKPSLKEYLLKEVRVTNKPGATFMYSNPGFNLLELLIEEVTGRDFNEYMQDEVLRPLGMNSSSFNWSEAWSAKVPMGYDLKGFPVGHYVYPYKASGGLFTTVDDIARFAIAGAASNKEEKQGVLSRKSIGEIQTAQVEITGLFGFVADSYGYGHFIETLAGGEKAVWHGGQGHGWMTHFHLIPETGDAIVVFTNSQRSWPMIASLLEDWSQWEGNGPVKFSRILIVVKALWILTGILFLLGLYRGISIFHNWRAGRRSVSFKLYPLTPGRVVEILLLLVLTSILVWSVNQEYLFIQSVFPVGSTLLGWGLGFLSVVLLTSVIFPIQRGPERSAKSSYEQQKYLI